MADFQAKKKDGVIKIEKTKGKKEKDKKKEVKQLSDVTQLELIEAVQKIADKTGVEIEEFSVEKELNKKK